jgi:hypothetical protein
MSSLPPLDVSVSSRKMSCILDGEFALSRQGLLFAVRLAQETNVWLFRAFWQTLDNSHLYALPAAERQDRREARRQWEFARLGTHLAGLCFFVGDAKHESLLPKEVENDLVERFESLSVELDGLHRSEGDAETAYDPVYECHRDTVALATALIRHRPIVFSLCARPGAGEAGLPEPAICTFLRQCGIDCRPVGHDRTMASIRSYLQPIFARSGAAELLWDLAKDGFTLAVLHIIAPHALVMPIETELDRRYGDETEFPSAAAEGSVWFRGASAYWWQYG